MEINGPVLKSQRALLEYLNAKQETKIILGLERVRGFLEKLGNPQSGLKFIHVAGTNAKGSVCAMLFSVLKAAGYKAGLYTSPHFEKINERIKTVDGDISDLELEALGDELRKISGHEELTYFEFLTVLAFVYFKRKNINPVVLETGLGGRLDATNVIEKPLVSVISSIGLDHCLWLGSTIGAVAGEKTGIVKQRAPVVIGEMSHEAVDVIKKQADRFDSRLIKVDNRDLKSEPFWLENWQSVQVSGKSWRVGLLGQNQGSNAAVVLKVIELIRQKGFVISDETLAEGLANVHWPCRWQVISSGGGSSTDYSTRNSVPLWILDVAHNPQAVEHFLETLRVSPWVGFSKRAIMGFMKDKDYSAMIDALIPYFDEFYCCDIEPPRGLKGVDVARVLGAKTGKKVIVFGSVAQAIAAAMNSSSCGVNAVLGSFRIVVPAWRHLA